MMSLYNIICMPQVIVAVSWESEQTKGMQFDRFHSALIQHTWFRRTHIYVQHHSHTLPHWTIEQTQGKFKFKMRADCKVSGTAYGFEINLISKKNIISVLLNNIKMNA